MKINFPRQSATLVSVRRPVSGEAQGGDGRESDRKMYRFILYPMFCIVFIFTVGYYIKLGYRLFLTAISLVLQYACLISQKFQYGQWLESQFANRKTKRLISFS